jgi:DNA-directed RNA polymerase subunit F
MIIESSKLITNSEAKDILTKKMKNRELNYEQQTTYEYLKNTTKLTKANAEKLKKELEEFGLKEQSLINIVNIVPKNEDVLKLILKKEELKPAQIKKILEIVSKY